MRGVVAALMLMVAVQAHAQPRWDCVTRACEFVTDPFQQIGTPVAMCRLYASGVMISETPLAYSSHGRGEYFCQWRVLFAEGPVQVWATAVSIDGAESGSSNVLNVVMQGGIMPPPFAPSGLRRVAW